jgi:hypothetical protein
MKRSFRFVLFAVLGASALILAVPLPTYAQGTSPAGVVAFVGVDSTGSAGLYVMDITSGRIGQIVIPVAPETDLAWNPAGDRLAFVTQDGGYGLLNSLRGCFDATATCADTVEVLTPFVTQQIEWSPDGDSLYFLTDDGMKVSAPRARPNEITDLSLACSVGFAISREPFFLFCASEDSAGDIQTSVYQVDGSNFTKFDVGPDGRSAVGTEEAAGDSGFYAPASGTPSRFAAYQIHVYDLEFRPDGNQIVIVGATADSTGDGTLRDGDAAELFLYDTATGQLHQVAGFTNVARLGCVRVCTSHYWPGNGHPGPLADRHGDSGTAANRYGHPAAKADRAAHAHAAAYPDAFPNAGPAADLHAHPQRHTRQSDGFRVPIRLQWCTAGQRRRYR